MKIQRTIETKAAPDAVFDFLSDFTTTVEWDPGTETTVRLDGDGGIGTSYRNVTKFAGRKIELVYEVVEHEPPVEFALRGENGSVVARDRMSIEPRGGGSRVTYIADFGFKGLLKYVAPLLAPAFKNLGDEGAKGMQEALDRL